MTIFKFPFVSATARLMLAAAALTTALAQDRADSPPSPVHLTWTTGAVSVRHGDDGPWVATAGVVNAPLAANDHIATGPKGQAGIQLDDANVYQAGSNAEIRLDLLEPGHYRLAVIKGAVTCHVAGTSTADVEVGTPSVAVRTSRPGIYLIAVNRARESEITVRAGDVEVVAPRGSEWVNAGQKMVARGPASDPQYKIGHAIPTWRRVAVIVATWVQVVGNVSSAVSSGAGEAESSSGSSKTTNPPKTAEPAAATRQTPTAAQIGNRK